MKRGETSRLVSSGISRPPPLRFAGAFCYNSVVRLRGGQTAATLGLIFTMLPGADGPGPAARESGVRQRRVATSADVRNTAHKFGIIMLIKALNRSFHMPAVAEAIDKMTTAEKFDTMNYLWSSLSFSGDELVPDWHRRELEKTEARVAAGMERPIPWDAAKEISKGAF